MLIMLSEIQHLLSGYDHKYVDICDFMPHVCMAELSFFVSFSSHWSADLQILQFITFCTCHSTHTHTHTHTYVRLTALPGWAGTRKVKPIWILLKQEKVSGSGISWAICKSASRSRQITMPAPATAIVLNIVYCDIVQEIIQLSRYDYILVKVCIARVYYVFFYYL